MRRAVGLVLATFLVYTLPIPPDGLPVLKGLLLLAAFGLTLRPLWLAGRDEEDAGSFSWILLFAGAVVGVSGQFAWVAYALISGGASSVVALQAAYTGWAVLTAVALAFEVSPGHRSSFRGELVIDLLLIGAIGSVLVAEMFRLLAGSSPAPPLELAIGGASMITSFGLAVAALAALMSPRALGGGVPRLLVVFGGFVAAVAHLVFSYQSLYGVDTTWVTPAWIFALLMISAAAADRLDGRGEQEKRRRQGPIRTLVVPVIVAYALSLLIREILASSTTNEGSGIVWGVLALLIVARVVAAIHVAESRATELLVWERRYETLVDTLGSVVYEWNPDSDRIVRSGATESVFGRSQVEIGDRTEGTFDMMHPEDQDRARAEFREANRRGGLFEIEYRIRDAEGDWRLIRDRGFCQRDDNGGPRRVLGIMSDVTNERDGEDRLRQAERLAALGGLAAGAAHEINNPLAAISLAAQMLLEDERLPADVLDDIQVIERQSARAGEVTDRMLVFARRREGERGAYEINDLVREVMRGQRYEIETHSIFLEETLAEGLDKIWVDPIQIERVVTNLIINAEKALVEIPEGSRTLTISTYAEAEGIVIEVSDNGPGIPDEQLPKIFDPFFTTREVGEGTGLGLSMSHSIVEAHGGELSVQTRVGVGTTFSVRLPRALGDQLDDSEKTLHGTRAVQVVEDAPAPVRRSLRVLVVDDEDHIRDLAKRFLSGRGHEVEEAENGRKALEMVTERDYDGILLDLRMPELSGEGFFEWLRRNRPVMATKVTVVSGDLANPETIETLRRIGQPYLLKPFKTDDLVRHVESAGIGASAVADSLS